MRPVNRGDAPKDANQKPIVFAHYRDARDHLIGRIGDYCSYCEVCLHGSIHVEHVRPKDPNPLREREWSNFLLACENCNSIKSDKNVVLNEYFWPDADNTARAFEYSLDEPPRVSNSLDHSNRTIAARTIELTGLDRLPGHQKYSDRDRRWHKRKEAWGVALHARQILAQNPCDQVRDLIAQNAVSRGFWSIWMAVFHDDPVMRHRFLNWFPGTARGECFDLQTNAKPRQSGQL